jgi:hypothetical protein
MNMWNRHHFKGPPANELHEIMKVNSQARLAPVSNGGGGRAGLRSEEEGSSSDLQNLKLCCFDVAPGIFNSSASLLTGRPRCLARRHYCTITRGPGDWGSGPL